LLAVAASLLVPLSDVASGRTVAVLTVTTSGDAVDAVPGDGVCRTRTGTCTLRAALNEASSLRGDGTPLTISVPAGTFALRLARPADPNRDEQGGDLDLFSHAAPPPSVTINGAGAGRTIIQQRLADRVLDLGTSEPVTIANLSIRGGHGVRQGGGVYNGVAGGLTLRGVEIAANSAQEGGGIYSIRSLAVDRSRISDNSAKRAGGGIVLNTRGGTIAASTVSGNTAQGLGGGIWAQNVDALDVSQSLIADNSVTTPGAPGVAPYGGGIMIGTDPALGVTSAVRIASTTIRSNSAGGGGGLAWQAPGTLTLEGSLLAANTAELGGAIATLSGGATDANNTVTLVDSTLSENAAERGGAIERGYGNTILRAVTIAGNTAPAGSGIDFDGARSVFAVATGTILANDPPARNCSRNGFTFDAVESLSVPGTNIENGGGCHLRAPDRVSTGPRLGPLRDNGGPTRTRALLPGSIAIDRYTAGDCPPTDQRGYSRPAGAACDIGAFESGAARSAVLSAPLRARRHVIGGRLTFTPFDSVQAASLGGGDYRPCGPGPQETQSRPTKLVTGGFFETGDGQLLTRSALLFSRDSERAVRFGNLFVVLEGKRGRVLALIAPGRGAVPLFDVVGVGYVRKSAHGRLVLTARAASILNRELGLSGFRSGMRCGRLDARLSVAADPGAPPFAAPPPPPPPPSPPPPPPPARFSLVVTVDPAQSGSVESRPEGVSCTEQCIADFAAGTSVLLTAKPAEGMAFDNWTGDCRGDGPTCTLTIDARKAVTAKFEKKP